MEVSVCVIQHICRAAVGSGAQPALGACALRQGQICFLKGHPETQMTNRESQALPVGIKGKGTRKKHCVRLRR
jgi:hypothetical protein